MYYVLVTDPEEMMSFASNLLCLGIGEGLLSLVAEAETRARETVHQAEEELEGQFSQYTAHNIIHNVCMYVVLMYIRAST